MGRASLYFQVNIMIHVAMVGVMMLYRLFDVKIPDGKAPGERFPHLTSSRRQIYLTVPPQGQPGQSKAYYTTAELVEATSQPKVCHIGLCAWIFRQFQS
eukprot:SAG31_NODE_714_length_12645_cov_15.347760_3_plen_99_part_00